MKTVLIQGKGNIGIQEAESPKVSTGHAVIEMKSLSICGSDVNTYRGSGVKVSYPRIPGHEAAGVITELLPEDAKSSGFQEGDRVIIDPYLYCGHCYACGLGRTNCCESLRCLGVHTDGAMREKLLHPLSHLVKMPETFSWEMAAPAEPLTISLHAIHRVALKENEHFVIFGAGPIGLLAALAAKNAYGAIPCLIDVEPKRLAYAQSLGISHTFMANADDLAKQVADITDGRMAEALMEASGAGNALQQSLTLASYCARIALTGWPSRETSMDTGIITRKELDVFGARNSKNEFPEAIRLIETGTVDALKILTKVVSFDELPHAFIDITEQPQNFLKIGAVMP